MRKTVILILLTGCLFIQVQARQAAEDLETTCRFISSQEAISQIKDKVGGKVVSIKLHKAGKNSVYKIRVLVGDNRIKNMTIKACKSS